MEKNGRFGNQIFQYFFLKLVQSQLGYEIRYPEWYGNSIFNIAPSKPLIKEIFEISYEAIAKKTDTPTLDLERLKNLITEKQLTSIDISGYFHYHTKHLEKFKGLFLETFKPYTDLAQNIKTLIERIRKPYNSLVAIHIRATDYLVHEKNNGGYGFAISPDFDEVAAQIKLLISTGTVNKSLIYLASDDLDYASAGLNKRGIAHVTSKDLCSNVSIDLRAIDFLTLSAADISLISNSSFSFSAAMLNTKGSQFYRPEINSKKYIPFNPWSDYVLHVKTKRLLYM